MVRLKPVRSGLREMERDIAPPLKRAITIPVTIDGKDVGLVVYVAWGVFTSGQPDLFVMRETARAIVNAIDGVEARSYMASTEDVEQEGCQ